MAAIVNRVVIGDEEDPLLTFNNDDIDSIVEERAVSAIGDELFIDQFMPVMHYNLLIRYVLVPADMETYNRLISADGYILTGRYNYDIRHIPYGTPVHFYSDNRAVGLFYVNTVDRKGKDLFQINCVSAIGLMDRQRHVGGIYIGERFETVLDEITGGEYSYEIEPDVAEIQVYGWLPYSSRRKNLHQLLLAYGVNLTKSDRGQMLFTFLNASEFYDIPAGRVFSGGNVEYGDPASRVEITEHSYHYLPTVEYEQLFDTQGETVENVIVTFDKPIYVDSLQTDETGNLTIHSAGVNYAIVSGSGVLSGQPYVHNTKLLTRDNGEAYTEKIVTVEDATLITLANSDNCLARIAEYYFNATVVTQDIRVDDERTGRRYRVENPFREDTVGFLSRMSVNTSSFRRAECEFITDYVPIAQGSSFLRRELLELTEAGQQWEIPQSVYEKDAPNIRVVLIGAGYDGEDGQPGEDGERASDSDGGFGGQGGQGGQGGDGGRILSATIDCENLAFIRFGKNGTDTWVTAGNQTYTSANGRSSITGYTDLFTGTVFALPGSAGVKGGNGGRGGRNPPIGTSPYNADSGENVEVNGVVYKGGKGGKNTGPRAQEEWSEFSPNITWKLGGGGGSGAAYGMNGEDGMSGLDLESDPHRIAEGGNGADGLDAVPTVALYGQGGNGGSGGGGGGGSAMWHWWNHEYSTLIGTESTNPGLGGIGGHGTQGYRGCLLIYY